MPCVIKRMPLPSGMGGCGAVRLGLEPIAPGKGAGASSSAGSEGAALDDVARQPEVGTTRDVGCSSGRVLAWELTGLLGVGWIAAHPDELKQMSPHPMAIVLR